MKKRILVIDEGRLMCYGLQKALSQEKIEVDTAFTVTYAVTTFKSCTYDLCLFDICPPDEKGFELMGVIRNAWPGMKIILMTANDITLYEDSDEVIHKAKSNGACHLLCKPFNLKLLKEVVLRTLREDSDDAWFGENFVVGATRNAERKPWRKQLNFFSSVIRDGEIQRLNFPAESVNIGDDGIELITSCYLQPADIISFDDDDLGGRKEGVVVWSSILDEQRYRVDILFA
ncbi:MAG: response regulator [Desulfobulbaceae bacterium]